MNYYVGHAPFQWRGDVNYDSPQLRGLACWWPMALARGGRCVEMIAGLHGVSYNGAGQRASEFGNALNLDGVNDYVQIDANERLNPSNFSLSSWFYNRDTASANKMSIMKARTSHSSPFYQYGFQFMTGAGVWNTNIGNTLRQQTFYYSDNTWNHVVAVVNEATSTIYVNGVQSVSNTYSGSMVAYATPLLFGANANLGKNSTYCWNGMLADVRLYNRPLTDSEVFALYDPQTRWELYSNSYVIWLISISRSHNIIPRVRYHMMQQGMT